MSEGTTGGTFVEVGHYQLFKSGEAAGGDSFLSQKQHGDGRVITVLSDGLGSGIKASVLSTLTATMAMKFVAADIPIKRAASIIMKTLPVCKHRGISYATFTLVDIEPTSAVRIIEYDNPAYVLVRENTVIDAIKQCSVIERKGERGAPPRDATLFYSAFNAKAGDRLVFFSDGVTQSGMGTRDLPLGWGYERVERFILGAIARDPGVSARELAREIVQEAMIHDVYQAKDDITCGVIYFRHPRDLLIMTGPPINRERDAEMARDFSAFSGRKIVCGGTTATILSRLLGKPVSLNLRHIDPEIPPVSQMEGADLITEGIITLGRVAEILERGVANAEGNAVERERDNGARRIVEMLLDSDRIRFVVGTRINEAHQDPNMPVGLEIRRNVVQKIQKLLVESYLKDVTVRYV
jgi:hypothetical protein